MYLQLHLQEKLVTLIKEIMNKTKAKRAIAKLQYNLKFTQIISNILKLACST
jgi:hypothetical protein